jgi:2-polyprenyl-3-methyl-5-hydroxy-6-metoxy-1,4-benzoquinol methylase
MPSLTSHYYQNHYRPIQWEKYTQGWSLIKTRLTYSIPSMLDVGIGYGWWEEFLATKKIIIPRIVGVDIDEGAVSPRKKNIEYHLGPAFSTKETFDFVVCWDAYHLLGKSTTNLWQWVKPNGFLLVSEPQPFAHRLDAIVGKGNVLMDEWVGKTEQSRMALLRPQN